MITEPNLQKHFVKPGHLQIIFALTAFFVNAFLVTGSCQYNDYNFENINGIQSISEGYINTITKDKTGFIWIGTVNGLIKFDGYTAVVYRHKPDDLNTLADDEIIGLCADNDDNIWIGTRNGLSRYNVKQDKFQNFFHNSKNAASLAGNEVHSIKKDKHGNIWVATYGGGLDVIEKKNIEDDKSNDQYKFRHYRYDEKDSTTLSSNQLFSVCFDIKGNGWIGTDNGLNFYDSSTNKFTRFYNDPLNEKSIAHTSVYRIFAANDSSVWVCGKSILDRITYQKKDNNYSFRVKHYLPLIAPGENLVNWNINGFILDKNNNGWIATNDFGLIKFSLNHAGDIINISKFVKNEASIYSIASSVVNEIFEDKSGIIWIGTGKGISKYIPSKNLFNESSLATNQQLSHCFYTMLDDKQGRLWLGYNSDTIIIIQKNKEENFIKRIKLPGSPANILEQVNIIFKSSGGDIYAGTLHQGMFILSAGNNNLNDKRNWKHFFKNNSPQLITNNIYSFAEDQNKNIWVGTYQGVYKYNPKTEELVPVFISPDGKLQSAYMIHSICIDQNNLIWCGTGNGLYILKNEKLYKTYKYHSGDSTSINNDQVSNIMQDKNKNIWVSTKAGINLYNSKTDNFKRIIYPDNFPQEAIKILQEDKNSNLWMGTSGGLARYDMKQNKVYTYTTIDGLCSNQFQANANCTDVNGVFYFGTDKGIVSFDPQKIKPNDYIPPVVITNTKILNRELSLSGDSTLLNTFKKEKKLILKYNQNFFSFEFAALNYINSAANQYMYILEGIDKDWIQSGTKRFADYTDIKPGSYTFKVKAANNDGVWNTVPATIEVIILPPWWQTWWFYSLCAFIVSTIVYTFYRIRLNQMLKLYKLRSTIAKDLHDDVGSALSSIALLSNIAQEEKTNTQLKPSEIFLRIGDTSKKMIDLMDDIVWSVNPDNDRFSNMLIRMREYAAEMLESKNIAFSFSAEDIDDLKIPMQMRKDYFLIFKEAVNNLTKYSHATNASITIEHVSHNLCTIIKDNGKGFDSSIIHSGNGLLNMKHRAETLHGKLIIETCITKGTSIKLNIPVP